MKHFSISLSNATNGSKTVQATVSLAAGATSSKAALTLLNQYLTVAPNLFTVGEVIGVRGFQVYPCFIVEALTSAQVTPIRLAKMFKSAAISAGFVEEGTGRYAKQVSEGTLKVRYVPLAGCFDVSMPNVL